MVKRAANANRGFIRDRKITTESQNNKANADEQKLTIAEMMRAKLQEKEIADTGDNLFSGPHNETQEIVDYMERDQCDGEYDFDPSDYTDIYESYQEN